MGQCKQCGSERVRTVHQDGKITTRCKEPSCGHVEIERYGSHRRRNPSEAEQAAQEVQG